MSLFKDLSPDELEELQRRIGGIMLMLPMASGQAGHATPSSTIKGHYLTFSGDETRVERIAKEFVIDLFTARTSKMCEKWYGDPRGSAVRRALRVTAPEAAQGESEHAPAAIPDEQRASIYTSWLLIRRAQAVPGQWVAHALDVDVVTQGSSPAHARQMASEAVEALLIETLQAGRSPYDHSAPAECWAPLFHLWRLGATVSTKEFVERMQSPAQDEGTLYAIQVAFMVTPAGVPPPKEPPKAHLPAYIGLSQSEELAP